MFLRENISNAFQKLSNKISPYSIVGLAVVSTATILFSFLILWRLLETPPTWMDEGIIIQTAINLHRYGDVLLQIAPTEFVSGWFVTTSFPVTFPIAVMFEILGQSLFSARIIMVIYLCLLFASSLFFIKLFTRSLPMSWLITGYTSLLLATFAPLYGHGKNVLGEIPGLTWLVFSALVFCSLAYVKKVYIQNILYIVLGVFLGMAIVTKPVFILIVFGIVLAIFLTLLRMYAHERKTLYEIFNNQIISILYSVCGASIPVIIWLFVQFEGQDIHTVMSVYVNPHSNPLAQALVSNIKLFFTEIQPMYAGVMFAIWTFVIGFKFFKRNYSLSYIELCAWSISFMIFLAFIRTAGYYRYFFIAQFITLVFFPYIVLCAYEILNSFYKIKYIHIFWMGSLTCVICAQLFYLYTGSWVFAYKDSIRTQEIQAWVDSLDDSDYIFLYQVPEFAVFLDTQPYSQYMKITPTLEIGQKSLSQIKDRIPDYIVLPLGEGDNLSEILWSYSVQMKFNRYEIWIKK